MILPGTTSVLVPTYHYSQHQQITTCTALSSGLQQQLLHTLVAICVVRFPQQFMPAQNLYKAENTQPNKELKKKKISFE